MVLKRLWIQRNEAVISLCPHVSSTERPAVFYSVKILDL